MRCDRIKRSLGSRSGCMWVGLAACVFVVMKIVAEAMPGCLLLGVSAVLGLSFPGGSNIARFFAKRWSFNAVRWEYGRI